MSFELRSPLSRCRGIENRDFPDSNPKHHELLQVILEECMADAQLTTILLTARRRVPASHCSRSASTCAQLTPKVTSDSRSAREKHVELEESLIEFGAG